EVSYANKIRPERTLGSSTVASALGITSSPVAAAMATLLPLVEIYHYNLVDVLLITIPASIVGIFVMSLVMSRHGKDLEDDAEYLRRVEAGEVQPPAAAGDVELMPYAKRSVAIFLGAVDAIVGALGDLASKWPFTIAIAIFMVAALTTSQSAATRTMVPLGLALGIGAGYMIAMWTAVSGVLFLPANGTQIAAAEADTTGT